MVLDLSDDGCLDEINTAKFLATFVVVLGLVDQDFEMGEMAERRNCAEAKGWRRGIIERNGPLGLVGAGAVVRDFGFPGAFIEECCRGCRARFVMRPIA